MGDDLAGVRDDLAGLVGVHDAETTRHTRPTLPPRRAYRSVVCMSAIPVGWQIAIQLFVPAITAVATVVGVVIAANRADHRRRADQQGEDARRQDEIAQRDNERNRQLEEKSKERQRGAVADFLKAVRRAEAEQSEATARMAAVETSDNDHYLVGVANQLLESGRSYSDLHRRLASAWEVLDLEITHPEVRKMVEVVHRATVAHGNQTVTFSRDVTNYLVQIAEDQSRIANLTYPVAPHLDGNYLECVGQLREAARQHLHVHPDGIDHASTCEGNVGDD